MELKRHKNFLNENNLSDADIERVEQSLSDGLERVAKTLEDKIENAENPERKKAFLEMYMDLILPADQKEEYKEMYAEMTKESNTDAINPTVKKGDRIELIEMTEDPDPIEKGAKGTVQDVDGLGHILVKWDNGRTLSLVPEVDRFKVLPN